MKFSVPAETTYVKWADCFYPEDAAVTNSSNSRVNTSNPLRIVYAEALDDLPLAHAVPISDLPEAQAHPIGQVPPAPPAPTPVVQGVAPATSATSTNLPVFTGTGSTTNPPENLPANVNTNTHKENSEFHHHQVSNSSFGLDFVIGAILCFTAVTMVFSVELTSWTLYLVAATFWHMNQIMEPPNLLTGLLYGIFQLIYWTLVLVDSLLLLVSVLTSELIAIICYLISCLFSGCHVAAQWHQYIRKTSHTLRWAFRSKMLLCTQPTRQFCCGMGRIQKPDHNQESATTTVVPTPSTPILPSNSNSSNNSPLVVTFDEPRNMYG